MYSILHAAKKLLRKLTAVFFIFLCVSLLLIGALWYRVNARLTVTHAVAQGDVRLLPFIDEISRVAYEIPEALTLLVRGSTFDALRDHADLSSEEIDRVVADVGTMLRTHPSIASCDYYNATGKQMVRIYLAPDGSVVRESQPVEESLRDLFLRGSVLEADELYMSKRVVQYNPRNNLDEEIISYAAPVRSANGALRGVIGLLVPSREFFASFSALKNPGTDFFVSDAEGSFLYHAYADSFEANTHQETKALFLDFPDGYPSIFSGRGERRVADGESFVQVRVLHPAFEVSVDGMLRRINTQGAPLQHRSWFIGYRENY